MGLGYHTDGAQSRTILAHCSPISFIAPLSTAGDPGCVQIPFRLFLRRFLATLMSFTLFRLSLSHGPRRTLLCPRIFPRSRLFLTSFRLFSPCIVFLFLFSSPHQYMTRRKKTTKNNGKRLTKIFFGSASSPSPSPFYTHIRSSLRSAFIVSERSGCITSPAAPPSPHTSVALLQLHQYPPLPPLPFHRSRRAF